MAHPARPGGRRQLAIMLAAGAATVALVGMWATGRNAAPPAASDARSTRDDAAVATLPVSPAPAADPFDFTETGTFVSHSGNVSYSGSRSPSGSGSPFLIPVPGVTAAELENTFGFPRPDDRRHVGIDIAAPLGTPLMAAADGWIVSLSYSAAGGRGLHLLDRTGRYLFYYAHLDAYADGLYAGMAVRQRELVGFVGVSGNAEQPHLHLEVGRIRSPGGLDVEPLNPYAVLGSAPAR